MPEVKNRRTVLIRHNLTTSVEWDENIIINFDPDEVIVRSVLYYTEQDEKAISPSYIYTSLVNESDALCVFAHEHKTSAPYNNPQSVFQLNSPVRGQFNFRALDITGAPTTANGRLMITLEFISYRRR